MKKIKLIRESDPKDFANKIQKSFLKGWKMKNNFSIDSENYLCQMMVKKAAKKKEKPDWIFGTKSEKDFDEIFTIITARKLDVFQAAIEELISIGWKMEDDYYEDSEYFHQKMIKDAPQHQ